jgi:cell division protein FtsI (penicillin-binding protein 3)
MIMHTMHRPLLSMRSLHGLLALLGGLAACQPDPAPAASAASAAPPAVSSVVSAASAPAPAWQAELSAQALSALRRRGVMARSVELTVRPAWQAIAERVVDGLAATPETVAVSLVAIDPSTGEIVALSGRRGTSGAAGLAAQQAEVPGSVMKTFSLATAIDQGRLRLDQSFAGEPLTIGGKTVSDQGTHGTMTLGDVLAFSSNVGTSRAVQGLDPAALAASLGRLGFGAAPDVELDGVAPGALPPADGWTPLESARVAYGAGGRVSPLQVAAALAAIANDGVYIAPTLVRGATGDDGRPLPARARRVERVLRPATADAVLGLLEGTVLREDGTGKGARVAGQRVAGKTGTATIDDAAGKRQAAHASFVGAVPARRPRLVAMVTIDTTRDGYTGGTVAAPAFADFATRALAELGVPPEPAR